MDQAEFTILPLISLFKHWQRKPSEPITFCLDFELSPSSPSCVCRGSDWINAADLILSRGTQYL